MSDDQSTKLSKNLDKRFDKIDEKLESHAKSFERFFIYMEKRFDAIEKKLDEKASQSSLDKLMITIDGFVKRLDDAEIEQTSRDRQFERLLEWARKVSEKTGIPLENL